MSLQLRNVALRLGEQTVLRDVSLELAPGEVVGLLGRNGAGKTSLLRLASGTWLPDAGDVLFEGRALSDFPRSLLAQKIAVVPQDLHVPFPFRVGEVVLMGRGPYQRWLGFESSHDIECAQRALERMEILHLADRRIPELSGGERQLVLIARALAQEPDCLLLDEPTAFLDLEHRIRVLEVVRELVASGASALLVSHDLSLAARCCERLLLLADGRVAAEGAPGEVLRADTLRRVLGFSASVIEGPDGLPLVVPKLGRKDSVERGA
jgi:iron complex transport system ATP-binding protein